MSDFKALVQSLSDPDITKRNYDAALNVIGKRVDEIWRYICKASKRNLQWWAFQNDVYDGEGNGSTGGSFDPDADATFINIEGDVHDFCTEDFCDFRDVTHNRHYKYGEGFPTELLWTDNWQEVVNKHIADAVEAHLKERAEKKEKKAQNKLKEKEKIERRKQRIDSIKSKVKDVLTDEEFTFLVQKLVH